MTEHDTKTEAGALAYILELAENNTYAMHLGNIRNPIPGSPVERHQDAFETCGALLERLKKDGP